MGIDYNAELIVGWHVVLPEVDEDGDEDERESVDTLLEPICKKLDCEYIWSGDAWCGETYGHYIRMNKKNDVTVDEMKTFMAKSIQIEQELEKAGIKVEPFLITTAQVIT